MAELTYADVRSAMQEALGTLHGAIHELSGSVAQLREIVNGIKNDTTNMPAVHLNATKTAQNTSSLQPSLMRIDAQLRHMQDVTASLQALMQTRGDIHQHVHNIEQLASHIDEFLGELHGKLDSFVRQLETHADKERS